MTNQMVEAAPSIPDAETLVLDMRDVSVRFDTPNGSFRAVNEVSLAINARETVGLVGESGCGKSTLARAALKLVPIESGEVRLRGQDLAALRGRALRQARRSAQMIFQDPRGSLDPRMSIGQIIGEPLRVHGLASRGEMSGRVREMMDLVGLSASLADRRPSQLSGGQQQRVGIARALITRPALVVCDEPVSALDVSIRAQIMNLLADLRESLDVAFLFIAHDLAVVEHMSDHVLVMYLGRLMESGDVRDLFGAPAHPYTRALTASAPSADPVAERRRRTAPLEGEVPSPLDPPSGCVFRTRCPWAAPECAGTVPPPVPPPGAHSPGHRAACLRLPAVHAADPPDRGGP